MSNFVEFKRAVAAQFESMAEGGRLFNVDPDRGQIWNTYLKAFPAGTNPIFRERTEHDCSCCKAFIRQVGGVVSIDENYRLVSIWDVTVPHPYQPVADALSGYVKSLAIQNGFLTDMPNIGTDHNYDTENPDILWEHFHVKVPGDYVVRRGRVGTELAAVFNAKNVFQRALEEINPEAIDVVLDLISQGSLYKGDEYRRQVLELRRYQEGYAKLEGQETASNYAWIHSGEDFVVSHIRNSSIGTLLVNLSEGMDLEHAVSRYEKITAPTNYKRPTALVTPRMVEDAKATVAELGLMNSMRRRFATYTDLKASDMVYVDRTSPLAMDEFDALARDAAARPGKAVLSRTDEISIEDFIENVVPHVGSIELLVENRHEANLMSLIAPESDVGNESLFKWDNGFSWAYNGDMTDSLKQRVKTAGGNVDGYMRVSLGWENSDDLDIHVEEPCEGDHIRFSHMKSAKTGGTLDVDANAHRVVPHPVENIVWSDTSKMLEGKYKVFVKNYRKRTPSDQGYQVQFEFMGKVWNWYSDKHPVDSANHQVLEFTLKGGQVTVDEKMPSTCASREVWGIQTEKFQPVSLVLASPNHWNGTAVGNKHWMFILRDCKNPESPRGFYNEYLRSDLDKHRKVFEILGNKMRVAPSDDQLSGVGFSTTQRNSVLCRVSGSFNRTLKINF